MSTSNVFHEKYNQIFEIQNDIARDVMTFLRKSINYIVYNVIVINL